MTGASLAATPIRSSVSARSRTSEADAAEERAVPTGTTTAAGRLVQLVEDLVRDRAVALVLGGLGSVLEEAESRHGRRGGGPRSLASSMSAPTRRTSAPKLAERARASPRRRSRARRRSHASEALGRPGRRRAVVPGRGGDDRLGAGLPVLGQHRSAPAT